MIIISKEQLAFLPNVQKSLEPKRTKRASLSVQFWGIKIRIKITWNQTNMTKGKKKDCFF